LADRVGLAGLTRLIGLRTDGGADGSGNDRGDAPVGNYVAGSDVAGTEVVEADGAAAW